MLTIEAVGVVSTVLCALKKIGHGCYKCNGPMYTTGCSLHCLVLRDVADEAGPDTKPTVEQLTLRLIESKRDIENPKICVDVERIN